MSSGGATGDPVGDNTATGPRSAVVKAAAGSVALLHAHCSEDDFSADFGWCIGQMMAPSCGHVQSLDADATVPIEHSVVGTDTSRHTCRASHTAATRATWARIHAI